VGERRGCGRYSEAPNVSTGISAKKQPSRRLPETPNLPVFQDRQNRAGPLTAKSPLAPECAADEGLAPRAMRPASVVPGRGAHRSPGSRRLLATDAGNRPRPRPLVTRDDITPHVRSRGSLPEPREPLVRGHRSRSPGRHHRSLAASHRETLRHWQFRVAATRARMNDGDHGPVRRALRSAQGTTDDPFGGIDCLRFPTAAIVRRADPLRLATLPSESTIGSGLHRFSPC